MSHVFISYSKRNKPYARRLAEHLIASGFDVWIDDRIDYGSLWVDVIQQAIEDCAAFVVIMTPEARESRWVQTECEYAAQKGKPVFPLLLAGEPFFRYVSVQYADVSDESMPLDSFLDEVAEHAPRKQGQGADVTAPEACEVKRPNVVPRAAPLPGRRKRSRTPLFAATGVAALLLVLALIFVLLDPLNDDPDDEPTQDDAAQVANPTQEPTPPDMTTPITSDCERDWFFGNDYALPGDCPAAEEVAFEGMIQNYGEGILIGLYTGDGRFFILENDGHYFDRVGSWDTSSAPVGACALQTVYGIAEIYIDNDTPDEIIGCPLEPVEIENINYQASITREGFVVYLGNWDGSETYRLSAPSSRPETEEGAWQRVR